MDRTSSDVRTTNGETAGALHAEVAFLRERVRAASLPEQVHARADVELSRLERLPASAFEYGLIRSYFEWLLALPWSHESTDRLDLGAARRELDLGHFGLEFVKEQITDRFAVMKTRGDGTSPVLAFVGPAGTGKTSLAHAIARALGRKLVRINVRGISDEAEIVGQRRALPDALPGRIIRALRNAGTRNPVIVIEEADKLAGGGRGDAVGALVEALDSKLRSRYTDHFLDVPFDLSKVFFIVTAPTLESMRESLAECCDPLFLPGYVQEEKLEIARTYLLPHERQRCGLTVGQFDLSEFDLKELVRTTTTEAGVSELKRQIAERARKAAREVAEGRPGAVATAGRSAQVRRGSTSRPDLRPEVGLARALVLSPEGATVTAIEVSRIPGEPDLTLTGPQSERLRELVWSALTILRARAPRYDLDAETFDRARLHIHVHELLVTGDLLSLGLPMVAALISAFTDKPIRGDVGLTGGISLRGGLRDVPGAVDKVLAARRLELAMAVVPLDSAAVLERLPVYVRDAIRIQPVATVDEALDLSMLQIIVPKPEEASAIGMFRTGKSGSKNAPGP
jgi:ATP-dependent Lon protease